jgi:hypothetical protein
MQRDLFRPSLRALVSGLLLSACGVLPEAELAPAGGPLGTQESALCSSLSVTQLSLQGISTYQGTMAGSGSWALSTGANAIRLEYYVDGVLRSAEERTGTSGSWYFSTSGIACGPRTFLVKAYPMVVDSNNNRTTCYDKVQTLTQTVTESCPQPTTPTASVSCSTSGTSSRWTVQCTGRASGGSGSFTPYWSWIYGTNTSSWSQTGWTEYVDCAYSQSAATLQLQFKVIDSNGVESNVAKSSIIKYCLPI